MKIYRLAKIIENPKLEEAAHKVVDKGKLILNVADEYRLNPEQLSEAVIDLRKANKLPVSKILEIFDNQVNSGKVDTKDIAYATNIPRDDVIWVIRRFRESPLPTTPLEIKQIIDLRKQGLSREEIASKVRLDVSTVTNSLKRAAPEMINKQRSKSEGNFIYNEYLKMIKPDNSNFKEVIESLIQKYGFDRKTILGMLKQRGIKNLAPAGPQPLTEEEKSTIMDSAYKGKNAKTISKETGRSPRSILDLIKKTDINLYNENFKQPEPPNTNVIDHIIKLLKAKTPKNEILSIIKNTHNINIGRSIIYKIDNKYVKPFQPKPISEEIPNKMQEDVKNNMQEEMQETTPFGFSGVLTRTMSLEEYNRKRQNFLTKEQIEEMKKKEIATSMNWYKRAQDYRIQHTAPTKADAPLYDLKDTYPDDIYSYNAAINYGHYGQNHPQDLDAIRIIQWAHNKPNATLTIYRAVPANLDNIDKISKLEDQKAYILKFGQIPKYINTQLDKSDYYEYISNELERLRNMPPQPKQPKMKINAGDWVTISRNYAKEHGESQLMGNYQILSKNVQAKDLHTDGDSILEWGYNP